jgi:hypothetical protein
MRHRAGQDTTWCPLRDVPTYDSLGGYITGTCEPQHPGDKASAEQLKDYLDRQLDSLTGRVILGSLTVLPGARNRAYGGASL